MLRSVQQKHMMHGLVEMVVTKAHQYMREYKARTGADIIDGAPATRFALRLKELIESGYGLIDQDTGSRQNTFCN